MYFKELNNLSVGNVPSQRLQVTFAASEAAFDSPLHWGCCAAAVLRNFNEHFNQNPRTEMESCADR